MSLFTSELRPAEITIVILLITSLILLPPLLTLWISPEVSWFVPYLVWLGIIFMVFGLQRLLSKHAL
jgi:hypothetical protein